MTARNPSRSLREILRPPLLLQPDSPDQQQARDDGQPHLEARALVVGEPLELVPGRLDHLRRRRVDDRQLGRERIGRRAIDLELGDRVRVVAQRLADPDVADGRRFDAHGSHAQPVAEVDDALDLGEQLERGRRVLRRAEHLVAVVGVGLQEERRHRTHHAQVVRQRAGGRVEELDDRTSCPTARPPVATLPSVTRRTSPCASC